MKQKKFLDKKGIGKMGVLIISLLGFFGLIFGLWTFVIDTGTGYGMAINSTYSNSFNQLQNSGEEIANQSNVFRNTLINDKSWTTKDYMIVGTGMISLILSMLFNIVPMMLATINIVLGMFASAGIPIYIIGLFTAGIVFYVSLSIIGMFRGKDF